MLQSFMVYTAKGLKSCLSYAHTTVRDEKSCISSLSLLFGLHL